jgi:hypothetical protein
MLMPNYQLSNLHLSGRYTLISEHGNERPDDPTYTLTANVVVTDDNGNPAPAGQTVHFVTVGVAGDKVKFLTGVNSQDNEGGTVGTVLSGAGGVATVRLCGYTHFICTFYAYLEVDSPTTQQLIVFGNEDAGAVPLIELPGGEPLKVEENKYSFTVKAVKGMLPQNPDQTAVILNGKLVDVYQYSDLLGSNQQGGIQIPYHLLILNENVAANVIHYFVQNVAGTTYLSQKTKFAVQGTPTAMPDPTLARSYPAPVPNPRFDSNIMTYFDLNPDTTHFVEFNIPASVELLPHDKVTFWIYVNGNTPDGSQKKAYSRSFTYEVPDDYNSTDGPFTVSISSQYFYNFTRAAPPAEDQNYLYFDYQVNDISWSHYWQGKIETAVQ